MAAKRFAAGSFKRLEPPEIVGSGYVVKSLEAALWAFNRSETFADGCLMAVNLGDDADTTAAIYGQIAGAFYGIDGIPSGWREKLAEKELISNFASGLHAKPESTEGMRGGWLRKGREAWVMVQCPDAAGFERVRVETAMPGGC